jgi:HAD superfamily hydrolase (TIGR01450 family)
MPGQAISDRFDAFLFDLDGVVYVGEDPLPGAVESLSRLREAGKQVRFLTNNPRPTRAQIARKLAGMGVEAREEEVVSSGRATASYLSDEGIDSAYVIGSRGLMTEVLGAGVEVVDAGPCEAVVVGADEYVTFAHVRQAVRLIFEGARFVATNADASFPTPKGPLPGTGAIVAAVQTTTGQKPVVVGKPFPPMFDVALRGLDCARAVMIGDTPASDIEGARRAGIPGVLISKDGSSASKGNTSPVDAAIEDLNGLFDPGVVLRERYEEARP